MNDDSGRWHSRNDRNYDQPHSRKSEDREKKKRILPPNSEKLSGTNGAPQNGRSGNEPLDNGALNKGDSETGKPDQSSPLQIPSYDANARSLTLDEVLLKKFRWAAPNQECILRAFQEEGWPKKIFDPLPRDELVNPKTRLHDTIKFLNKGQEPFGVRFRGDGTGEGVTWELVVALVDEQNGA